MEVNFRNFETSHFQIDFERQQLLKFNPESIIVPGSHLLRAVECQNELAYLSVGQVFNNDTRHQR